MSWKSDEERRAYYREYYKRKKWRILELSKGYRDDMTEEEKLARKEKMKEYYEENKESIKESAKEYKKKNRERWNEYQREYKRKKYWETKEQIGSTGDYPAEPSQK